MRTKMNILVRLLLLTIVASRSLVNGQTSADFTSEKAVLDSELPEETETLDQSEGLLRSFTIKPLKPAYEFTSPYQITPGSYEIKDNGYYQAGGVYNARSIYANYLTSGAYQHHSSKCLNHYGQVPKISQEEIGKAFVYANQQLKLRYPEYGNTSHYQSTSHKEVEGHLLELVSEFFAKFKCFSKYQLATFLPVIPIGKAYFYQNQQGDVSCTAFYNQHYQCSAHYKSKYRTIDGSCNNVHHPYWGRSNTCHIRLLPPDYSDGLQEFRMSRSGKPLPNPRFISNVVTVSRDYKAFYTSLFLAWGQFINHDISNTEFHKSNPIEKIDCCVKPNAKCAAIPINANNDYIRAKYQAKCFNFMRASPCPLCKLGPREQMNVQTSFLDGSQIYGATDKEAAKLRAFQNGYLLAVSDKFGKPILPPTKDAQPCTPLKKGMQCFVAGDSRVNQHPLLLAMHTLLMRNHNEHATKLRFVNPHWNDERLYQEARRITIAEIQHITVNEYLPIVLGPILLSYYNLAPLKTGYSNYEPFTDPSSWNEYTTAAGRFGHSQIKDHYKTLANNYVNFSMFHLKDNFFEPGFAWDGLMDDIIRGITNDPANTVDPYYSVTAKNFIMRPKTKNFGIDLIATNIQRGRDHGIPGYIHFLKACFNYEAKSWNDLEKFIPTETLVKLREIYGSIEDIDLYIAGVSERHFIDAAIGPTFGCLVGIQFNHLSKGDRYWYEHGGQSGSFTPAQLNNIRNSATLARLLCRTGNHLGKLHPKPFYLPSRYNLPIECIAFPSINYYLWKE